MYNDGIGGILDCALWYECSGSPDYWTECSGINQIPNTGPSYQYAHSGNKMIGIGTYFTPLTTGSNFREILGIDLTNNVMVGQKYFFSMFINQAFDKNIWYSVLATNRMGVRLTSTQYSPGNPPPFNIADYCDSTFHTDTLNWTKISGSFIASGNYSKLMIGNFFDDTHTDTMYLSNDSLIYQYADAYYFIDDVCLSTDSLYAATWTGIEEHVSKITINVFPNPAHDKLFIEGINKSQFTTEIYDIQGREIMEVKKALNNQNYINVESLEPGIYLLILYDEEERFVKRFVKV